MHRRTSLSLAVACLVFARSALGDVPDQNLKPEHQDECWSLLASVDPNPAAQYLEKFEGCFILVGSIKLDLAANTARAAGKLWGTEQCSFASLAISHSVHDMGYRRWKWNCGGKGEVEGWARFSRAGFANFRSGDGGYAVDNEIELITSLLHVRWNALVGATAAGGIAPGGSPPARSVGGQVSVGPAAGVGVSIGATAGGSPAPLSYQKSLSVPDFMVWEGPSCLTYYERQIRTRSEMGGWIDGSPFAPAHFHVEVDSRLESKFSLIRCPTEE